MIKKMLIGVFVLIACASIASAEIVRQKNIASYVVFTLWKNDGTLLSSATGLDSEIDTFADGAAPDGFADCTNEAQEIGSSGHYYLSLTNTELNADYIVLQVKSSSTGAITRTLKIRTMVGDPLNAATTDDGGTINVTTGKIDEVNKLTEFDEDNTTIDINATTIGTASTVTNAVVLPTGTGAGQIALSSGTVTVGTNNDKTGYTASTVSDKTGYSLTQAFPTNFSVLSISATTGLVDVTQTAADKVWGSATRTLTAIDEDSTTLDLDATKFGGLSAAGLADFFDTDSGTTYASAVAGSVVKEIADNAGGSALTEGGIADAVWDEAISGHLGAGTTGAALNAAGSAGDPWSTPIPGAYGAGTAGKILGDNINAPIATVDTVVDAIKTQTDKLAFTVANKIDANVYTWNGTAVATPATAGIPDVNMKNIANAAVSTSTAQLGVNAVQIGAAVPGSATIGTVTNLTNAPTNGDLTATMKTSVTTAASSATPALSAAGVDAIWDELKSGHSVAGSFGLYLDAAITSRSTLTATDNIGINWADVSAPTTTLNLSGTTFSTSQAVASVSGAVGSVTGGVTVTTNNDKTGYTASTVSDKTGYSLTQAFPANFSALSISATTGLVDLTQTAADKVWGTTARTITGLTAAALADFFDTNSGTVYGSAVAGSVVKEIADNAGGSALTESGIADAVWNEARLGHTSPGTFGLYLDAQVSAAGSITAADVWAYATRTLTAGAYAGLTAADVDLLWDELMTGHTTAGSFGKTISNINDATDGDKEGSVYTGIEKTIREHGI